MDRTGESATPATGGTGPWGVVRVLCLTQIVGWGVLYYSFLVSLAAIAADTGWGATPALAAFSAALVVAALAGVAVGRVIDRHGPRLLMSAGSALGAVAVVVIAWAPEFAWFVGGWVLAGLAQSMVLYAPAFTAITRWFGPATRTRALLTVTLVAGLSSTIFAPLTTALVEEIGWRRTYLVLAALLAVTTIPAHAVGLRAPWPPEHRNQPDLARPDHGRDRTPGPTAEVPPAPEDDRNRALDPDESASAPENGENRALDAADQPATAPENGENRALDPTDQPASAPENGENRALDPTDQPASAPEGALTDRAGALPPTPRRGPSAGTARMARRRSEGWHAIARSRSFVLLTAATALGAFAMFAATIHLVPMLTWRGLTATAAAWGLGLSGAGQLLGRLGYAPLARHTTAVSRAAGTLAVAGLGIAAVGLLPGPASALIGAAIALGVVRGAFTLLQSTAISDRWGAEGFGTLYGIFNAPNMLAMAVAPWAAGFLTDVTGSYPTTFAILAGAACVAALIATRTAAGASRGTG
ncbi:MFS transporter [Occultella glacieicola]|uniref:MFS transporter n=1 Tax=Occultella glacieicola TaxID=2518684 RepID=UPI0014045A3C|nr:MFS transporter [Occultella glacieicola]